MAATQFEVIKTANNNNAEEPEAKINRRKDGNPKWTRSNKQKGVSSLVYPIKNKEKFAAFNAYFRDQIDKSYTEYKRYVAARNNLLVAVGNNTAYRISDIVRLKWGDLLDDKTRKQEKKTKKNRTIRINPQLKRHIAECYDHIQPIGINSPILVSQKGTTYSVQRINVILKEIKAKYKLKVQHFSCHSLRKTFGRQVYNQNAENAELALVKLMELFNHSSVAITKRYLGLRQEEILQTYDSLSF